MSNQKEILQYKKSLLAQFNIDGLTFKQKLDAIEGLPTSNGFQQQAKLQLKDNLLHISMFVDIAFNKYHNDTEKMTRYIFDKITSIVSEPVNNKHYLVEEAARRIREIDIDGIVKIIVPATKSNTVKKNRKSASKKLVSQL